MIRQLKILKYCFKEVMNAKLFITLFVALFLYTAFYQYSVVSYIYYFEGLIPFIFSIIFLNILSISDETGMLNFENKTQFSKFRLYQFRYICCFAIAFVFFIVTFVEYGILFFDKIDIYGIGNWDGVQYSNIGIIKVIISFLVSLLVLTKIQVFINAFIKNKYVSLVLIFFFVMINSVYRNFPFNYLSLYFFGDQWIANKLIWLTICIILDVLIYSKNKRKGYIVS